ncbi:hypothetical protein DL771_006186 [Monosporascus sp. 5C6A]|nr:hypothetical protein DL771_006186 [Monosporascus sp. 5C6A]
MLLSPRTLRAFPFKEDPLEKRTFTSRPVRKAVCLLCLLSGGLILFKRQINPGDLASETYQTYKDLHLRLPSTTQNTEDAFRKIRHQYEMKSPLNNDSGEWISRHGTNRYRDWGELRYSLRSLDRYAAGFTNKIQILVNSVTAEPDGTGGLRSRRSVDSK